MHNFKKQKSVSSAVGVASSVVGVLCVAGMKRQARAPTAHTHKGSYSYVSLYVLNFLYFIYMGVLPACMNVHRVLTWCLRWG